MNTGYLLLEGGAEFSPCISDPDLRAIELAGGFDAPIVILPTAAAPDNNHRRAGGNGVRWFKSLGCTDVQTVEVIERATANDTSLAASIRAAKLVYLLGGFPRHLGETLANSLAWEAALEAWANGAVISGSSAGAMVLCEYYYDPYEKKLLRGLNLIPNACVLPHHNNSGKRWADQMAKLLPEALLIGIDECTGLINDASGNWSVCGPGQVTLYRNPAESRRGNGVQISVHVRGDVVTSNELKVQNNVSVGGQDGNRF